MGSPGGEPDGSVWESLGTGLAERPSPSGYGHYLGSTRRAGQGTAAQRAHRFEDILARSPFGAPQSLFVPGIPDLLRDSESVLSGYFSLSWSAPHLFGDRLEDLARDVRALLASRSPERMFWDWPGDTEVVPGRKSR